MVWQTLRTPYWGQKRTLQGLLAISETLERCPQTLRTIFGTRNGAPRGLFGTFRGGLSYRKTVLPIFALGWHRGKGDLEQF